jgi:hypothetical protein
MPTRAAMTTAADLKKLIPLGAKPRRQQQGKKLVLKGAGAPDLQLREGSIPSHHRQGCRRGGREGPEKEAAEGSRGEEPYERRK